MNAGTPRIPHLQADSPLTPALVLLFGECPGSVLQGQDAIGFQARLRGPDRSGLCVQGRWELAAPSRQRRRGRASSRAPKARGNGGVDPSRESELLQAGPPSPRPRRPSFLPLTPGRAGGCWTGTDKSLADWPRLIRSRADPGGNRRAGISERGPHSPAPGRRRTGPSPLRASPSVPPRHWSGPGPLRTPTQCTAGSEVPGCTQRGNRGREVAASSVAWVPPPALNTPCPSVRADGGGGEPFPAVLGPHDPGPPAAPPLLTLLGSSFYATPPRLCTTPTPDGGTGGKAVLTVRPWVSSQGRCPGRPGLVSTPPFKAQEDERKCHGWEGLLRGPGMAKLYNRCPQRIPTGCRSSRPPEHTGPAWWSLALIPHHQPLGVEGRMVIGVGQLSGSGDGAQRWPAASRKGAPPAPIAWW